ncbi:hypothetical protein [Stutzerimonas chloritidismutans]|uniref:hypothetical protein n=1 Tax=Stutzerimonas chloritidismutans TaxID=203192 RepID=UPI003F14A895
MKTLATWIAGAALITSGWAGADEIVEARPDRVVGGGFGGLSGFMLGAAAGGPIGALVGGGAGYLLGQQVQGAAGLEQRLYVIRTADGRLLRVRRSAEESAEGVVTP